MAMSPTMLRPPVHRFILSMALKKPWSVLSVAKNAAYPPWPVLSVAKKAAYPPWPLECLCPRARAHNSWTQAVHWRQQTITSFYKIYHTFIHHSIRLMGRCVMWCTWLVVICSVHWLSTSTIPSPAPAVCHLFRLRGLARVNCAFWKEMFLQLFTFSPFFVVKSWRVYPGLNPCEVRCWTVRQMAGAQILKIKHNLKIFPVAGKYLWW